ncbi:MAG TPA: PQQ-dependent sugar dehydrogenase [Aggregatilineales bacterium]|nr:PQQ-dependent sugar dehydrogenase [Anaerolineae bacterium]HUN09125.1 PQQ-dependent sugar dehydrogenase [Aggregatilineales bacterium]
MPPSAVSSRLPASRFPLAGYRLISLVGLLLALAACDPGSPGAFQATLPPLTVDAPIYTETPTPSATPTATETPIFTATPTLTPTPTETPTPLYTPTATPTVPLLTLTPVVLGAAPAAYLNPPADRSAPFGWSCQDFPCEDDLDGWLQRIRVPAGFTVEPVGRFPGAPMQITYGPDGLLYATVLEGGTREGAVYRLNADGSTTRYQGGSLHTPIGLAFQPGTGILYVSARESALQGGAIYRIDGEGAEPISVRGGLPCCYSLIDNQPAGMVFGPDGYLYLGIGALTDRLEPADPKTAANATLVPGEASILRIQPHTAEVSVWAQGLRYPYDLTFNASGQFFATDTGLLTGPGDRLVAPAAGLHFGWPYWRWRGCDACPPTDGTIQQSPDLTRFPDFSLPRGIVAYTGSQFPANLFGSLFVALWNNTFDGQAIVRVDPTDWRLQRDDYRAEPFVTGLIRPIDVTQDPSGALVVADYVYGWVWRVRYTG